MRLPGVSFRRPRLHQWAVLAVAVAAGLLLLLANRYSAGHMYTFDTGEAQEGLNVRVVHIWARDISPVYADNRLLESVTVYFEGEITGGPRRGQRVSAEQIGDPFLPVPMREVQVGDRVSLISYQRSPEETVWAMQQYLRTGPLLALGAVFAVLLLLFGGRKGVGTLLSLAYTCLAIFAVFIPLILCGYNIYLVTLGICLYITVVTLVLVNGINKKSFSAGVGCLAGLLVAGGLTALMDGVLALTGVVSEESAFLLYMMPDQAIDLKAIIFSGILIGALGATMDVAVSMASSISELHASTEESTFGRLLRSGLNIGRDIMGTMTNTLILAYIGGSLSLSLLLVVYSNSLTELLNREQIVVEILQAVVGSIGLLCAIPLTAVFTAWLYTRGSKRDTAA